MIRPAGSRAQRMKESHGSLEVYKSYGRIGRLRHRVVPAGYRIELAWPLRALGWIVVAALAWLASPWLVVPAIVASELAWLVVMRSTPGRRTVHTGCGSGGSPMP